MPTVIMLKKQNVALYQLQAGYTGHITVIQSGNDEGSNH